MNYSVRMRTLTWKSSFGFGYDDMKDLTMLQICDLGKGYKLIKAYYFLGKINFIDEILDFLGITEELRIEKPSDMRNKKGHELYKQALDNFFSGQDELERLKLKSHNRSQSKRRRNNISSTITITSSKSSLQGKNHGRGHYKL